MSGNPVSKRRALGDAISYLRGESGLTKHVLADKTRTTVKIVERWEAGDSVPTAQEWQRMRQVFPPLLSAGSRYVELYRAAAAEQLAIEQLAEHKQPEDEMSTAIKLVLEAAPNLRSLTIEVDDEGEVSVAFKTREVRVVESDGSLSLKVKR